MNLQVVLLEFNGVRVRRARVARCCKHMLMFVGGHRALGASRLWDSENYGLVRGLWALEFVHGCSQNSRVYHHPK